MNNLVYTLTGVPTGVNDRLMLSKLSMPGNNN